MTRFILFSFLFIANTTLGFSQTDASRRISVTNNGHYLQYEDGKPFFWLGDTAWDLFVRLNIDQIKTYLDNRAAKGFNVIQAVVLSERGLNTPNSYGEVPLINQDPKTPNEKYFALIDSTIKLAAERNLYIGLLPTWADKVTKMWGIGPEIFDSINTYTYAKWLANRYKGNKNIIWIIGGDRPAVDSIDYRPIWRAMAQGIRDASDGKELITYHPSGESSSSKFWPNENSPLDFNMMQSGHGAPDYPSWNTILNDYHLKPAKPTLDGEPNYEDHPISWDAKKGYFRDYDVRKQIYRSVFSGGCGVTYGHNSIFFFYRPGDKNINHAEHFWYEDLDRPGAFQAGYLKELILSRPALNRVPEQTMLVNGQGTDKAHHITAFRDAENSYAMIYMPVGQTVEINTTFLNAKKIKAWWYNPRTGKAGKSFTTKSAPAFKYTPPSLGIKNDWVLVLDDPSKNYKKPGANYDYKK